MDLLFNDVLLPAINIILAAGLPLPAIPGITLVDPQLSLGSGYLGIATNFTLGAVPAV